MNGVSAELELQEETEIGKSKRLFYPIIKRFFDFILAGVSLLLLSPLFLFIAVLIKCDSKGKVFYQHKRIGKNGEVIYLFKFRSMYVDAKERLDELLKNPKIRKEWEENFKLNDDPRITKIGKFLRKSSLDELPQLLNILKGEMSIVGPRPVIEQEIEKYGKYKDKFLSITPGLTGWWAVNGRSCTSYEDRMKLELFYVDHRSIKLDVKIIAKTFISVIKSDGAK